MTKRNLNKISSTLEFNSFINSYNFKMKLIEGSIFLKSNSLLIEIYAYTIEEVIYFDIYTNNLQNYTNIDRILEGFDKNSILSILEHQRKTRNISISDDDNTPNLEITLKFEQLFFAYIDMCSKFLDDFLKGNFNEFEACFSETFEVKKMQLEKICKENF